MFTTTTYIIIGLLLIQSIIVPRISQSKWFLAILPVLIILYGAYQAFIVKIGHQFWLTIGLYLIMAIVFWLAGQSARNKIAANQKSK